MPPTASTPLPNRIIEQVRERCVALAWVWPIRKRYAFRRTRFAGTSILPRQHVRQEDRFSVWYMKTGASAQDRPSRHLRYHGSDSRGVRFNPECRSFLGWRNLAMQLPQDVRRMLRRQVTTVLRQALRRDEVGFSYRAKQSVMVIEDDGTTHRVWFDTDKGGTPNLRQKTVRQRRDGIASDVFRATCDIEHMNKTFPKEPQLSFLMDFAEDIAERRAAELLDQNKDAA